MSDTPELQAAESMLDRWDEIKCTCDPDVGHLCEVCHDTQVVRDLVKRCESAGDMVVKQHAVLQKHVGEMARARGAMQELGETEGTFYQRVKELGVYKRAMQSMAAQIMHPKMTAKQMAEMQLETQ